MAIKVVGIHHHGVRIDTDAQSPETIYNFYSNLLGLKHDEARPDFPGVPGWWMNVGDGGQIHLFGGATPSPAAKGPGQDPAAPHVALAVENIIEAKAEIERLGLPHFTANAGELAQVFLHDPCGNMIELHQFDRCRCTSANRNT